MEDNQEKKKFIMKVGIISIMILILIFWVLNAKNVFNNQPENIIGEDAQLLEVKDELNSAVNKLGESLDKIRATDERLNVASSSLVDEIVRGVNDFASSSAAQIASSSIVASSTASISDFPISEKTNSNCPAYVNCMPTIGEAPACYVSPACEGITERVY